MASVMITPLYAGILGLLLMLLSLLVVKQRMKHKVLLGDDGVPALRLAIRVHANFIEYVPLALVLILLLELMAAPPALLHGLGIALLAGRIGHAQGLGRTAKPSVGRFLGTLLTWGAILVASVALLARTML